MRKVKTIKVYQDARNYWGCVPTKELERLGLSEKISGESYIRGETAYLENNRDLNIYIDALKNRDLIESVELSVNRSNTRSRIRRYPRFNKSFIGLSKHIKTGTEFNFRNDKYRVLGFLKDDKYIMAINLSGESKQIPVSDLGYYICPEDAELIRSR